MACGEAAFLLAIGERLRTLGAPGMLADQLHGVELHEPSAQQALALLGQEVMAATVTSADFFDSDSQIRYDAVVGNPPYVRYQNFTGTARDKSREAASAQGGGVDRLGQLLAVLYAKSCLRHSEYTFSENTFSRHSGE